MIFPNNIFQFWGYPAFDPFWDEPKWLGTVGELQISEVCAQQSGHLTPGGCINKENHDSQLKAVNRDTLGAMW